MVPNRICIASIFYKIDLLATAMCNTLFIDNSRPKELISDVILGLRSLSNLKNMLAATSITIYTINVIFWYLTKASLRNTLIWCNTWQANLSNNLFLSFDINLTLKIKITGKLMMRYGRRNCMHKRAVCEMVWHKLLVHCTNIILMTNFMINSLYRWVYIIRNNSLLHLYACSSNRYRPYMGYFKNATTVCA